MQTPQAFLSVPHEGKLCHPMQSSAISSLMHKIHLPCDVDAQFTVHTVNNVALRKRDVEYLRSSGIHPDRAVALDSSERRFASSVLLHALNVV